MTPKVSFSKLSSDTSAWFHAPQNWLLHLSGAMFKEAIAFTPSRDPRESEHPSPAEPDARR